jgi:hypothetical protein
MPDFVYDIPFRQLAVYFAIIAVGAMVFGILVVKPVLRLLLGSDPRINESVGYATAGFNLFYGLLLGLLTVAAYQNSERVREGILNEATAIGALYSDMSTYPEPIRSDMREMLRDYVLFTIHKDWEAHREGSFLNGGGNRTGAMRQLLASFEPQTVGEEVIHTEVVGAFQDFIEARQRRLNGVITEIPDVLWYAVLVGAFFNVLLVIMLRIRPLQHFFLGTISSFFLGVILFVIVALDDPLRGEAGLAPGPFQQLWEQVMVWDEPQFRGA